MQELKRRRVQRIQLSQPIVARLGSLQVVLVDISVLGARVESHQPLSSATGMKLSFSWDGGELVLPCTVARSQLERFSTGADGMTVYHSGLSFDDPSPETTAALKQMIGRFITRALEEQKLNARGVLPVSTDNMPIFRFGQLTSNLSDKSEASGMSSLPVARIQRESGYVCYRLDQRSWRKKRTHDPGQPPEGFTISATEDPDQAALLCDVYEKADPSGRKLIRLFAQLSIVDGEGIPAGRFDP